MVRSFFVCVLGLFAVGCGEEGGEAGGPNLDRTVPGLGQPLLEHAPHTQKPPVDQPFVLALGLAAEPTGYNTLLVAPDGVCRYIFFQKTKTQTYTPRSIQWNGGVEVYQSIRRIVQKEAFGAMHQTYRGPAGTNQQVACAIIDVVAGRRWEVRCDNHTPPPLAELIAHCQSQILAKADLRKAELFDAQKMLSLWVQIAP